MRAALLDRACAAPSPRRAGAPGPTNSSSVARPHAHGERLLGRRDRASGRAAARRCLEELFPSPWKSRSGRYSAVPDGRLERRTTELLQRLIRFNTVNPPGNEQAAQEFLQDTLEAAGFECELLAAVEGRPNLVARLRGRLRRPDAVPARPRRHRARRPRRLERRPVVGRAARRLRLGPRRARHEEPGGRRGRRGDARSPRRAGGPSPASCWSSSPPTRRPARPYGAQWLCERAPRQGALRLRRQRGRRRGRSSSTAAASTASASPRRASSASRSPRTGAPGHASIPRIGDNALTKLAPVLEALRDGRPALELSPEPEALIAGARARPGRPRGGARERSRRATRASAVLLEPMLGVTLHADDGPRLARRST